MAAFLHCTNLILNKSRSSTATCLTMSGALPKLAFSKYQGLGNDFILIDNRHQSSPLLTPEQSSKLCDRHFGIGADGVIFLLPPPQSSDAPLDYSMRIYNSDGSEPEMCGNGIRCLAKFAAECESIETYDKSYRIHTLAGTIVPELNQNGMVTVDMGEPQLEIEKIPADELYMKRSSDTSGYDGTRVIQVGENDKERSIVLVSMGNPHCVTFVEKSEYDMFDESLEQVGPLWECYKGFPNKINTEFVQVESKDRVLMLVWERGAGRTLACGTGACAVVVAGVLAGKTNRICEVILPGGPLTIEWRESDNRVYMTGPADLVFSGQLAQTAST